ncbi:MAG: alpha/beta fold hydrolase, partial [Blautia sp.]|nr:alpha/beta fold hydrolase [Blautia sp.]
MKYEGSFLSEVDQLEISVLAYIPDEKPYRGVIQLVHGMCEYKERYIPFMEYLKDKGYVSVIHDHRGHGKSIKSIEDLGYMYGGGAEAIISDMRTINRGIHERFPDIPVILFGHSMGSLAVRAYTSAYDRTIDALIVCGSPSKNSALPFAKFLAKTEGRIRGEKHRSKLLTALSLGSYAAKFRKEGYKNAWLCSD